MDSEKYCMYTPYNLPELKTDIFHLKSIVYFLYDLNNIVYIGQSVTGIKRIRTHIKNKKFNRWYALEVPKENLNRVECYYINKYQPPYNNTSSKRNNTNKKNIITDKEVKNFFDISCINNTVSESRINEILAQLKGLDTSSNNVFDIFSEIRKLKSLERVVYFSQKSELKKKRRKTKKTNLKKESKPPYGYAYSADKKSIVVADQEAATVKRIFSLAQTGNSIQKIVDVLNGGGLVTKQGKAWTKATVHGMLRNSFYTGVLTHQQKQIQGNHTAIISKVQFGKVRKQLERRHK